MLRSLATKNALVPTVQEVTSYFVTYVTGFYASCMGSTLSEWRNNKTKLEQEFKTTSKKISSSSVHPRLARVASRSTNWYVHNDPLPVCIDMDERRPIAKDDHVRLMVESEHLAPTSPAPMTEGGGRGQQQRRWPRSCSARRRRGSRRRRGGGSRGHASSASSGRHGGARPRRRVCVGGMSASVGSRRT